MTDPTPGDADASSSCSRELIGTSVLGILTLGLLVGVVFVPIEASRTVERVGAMSERAEAEIVRIMRVKTQSGDSRYPVFGWEHAGTRYEHRSNTHESSLAVNDRVWIRFDPRNPEVVAQDRWSSLYGDLIVLLVVGPLVLLPLASLCTYRFALDVRARFRRRRGGGDARARAVDRRADEHTRA